MTSDGRFPPVRNETVDLTEEFDCDVTIELPDEGGKAVAAPTAGSDCGAPGFVPAAAADHASEGDVLCARYVLEQPLGNGGTALVSRARDLSRSEAPEGERYVAIKRLRPELRDRPGSVARLRREFNQTRALAHPNIVRFHDLHCDQGTWFITMELLAGEALGDRLRRVESAGLPQHEALRIASDCGNALEFAHRHGVTHGDIKPDNLFLSAANEVRVLDFGAAACSAKPAPVDGAVAERVAPAATRAYASPEVLARQEPEPRDDVFSLACVIYEMFSGRHPYGRRSANEARDVGVTIARPPGLSDRQWQTLRAGLAWQRERRPRDVRGLLDGLGAVAPVAEPVRHAPRLPVTAIPFAAQQQPSRAWRGAIACACVAVLGVLSGVVGLESESGAQSAAAMGPSVASHPNAAPAGDIGVPAPADTASAAAAGAGASDLPGGVVAHRPPARITFDSGFMVVSQRAVAAAIPVRRMDGAGQRVSVAWRATDGTAVSGRDYVDPGGGVAWLAEGQTVTIIYVPIMTGAATVGDRSFTIDLIDAASHTDPAAQRRIVVTIQDDR